MEGDFLFWLVDCKSHSLVNVFTFSGGWKPVEDANLYSNLSSSQRPFLVTLDITKLLPDSCTSSHPPLKACVPRRATAQRRSQGASPPAEGAEGPRPDASGRREAGAGGFAAAPPQRPPISGRTSIKSVVSLSPTRRPVAASPGTGWRFRGLARSPLPPRGFHHLQEEGLGGGTAG